MTAHGRVWVDVGDITTEVVGNTRYYGRCRLNWGNLLVDTSKIKELSFFRLLFPMKFLNETIIPTTNIVLERFRHKTTNAPEFIKFLGITLSMALEPSRGGLDAYWYTTEAMNNTIYTHRGYTERFKMSRDRFKSLRKCFRLARDENRALLAPTDPDIDPWGAIRPFIKAFNENRQEKVTPGGTLTVDEVMSMWLGLDSEYAVEGIPHLTKIIRKPRGIGAEMKAMCCGDSGILMTLELMEGKETESMKKWHGEYGHGAAVMMRLVEYWKGSGRIVTADSAFSSIKALIALHKELGLYFQGIVKTAHKEYPRKYMEDWYKRGWDPYPRREIGSWKTLTVCNTMIIITY